MKRRGVRKLISFIFAILILFGLANCLILEPAFALSHDESQCADTETHCCFICNANQHQWNISDLAIDVSPLQIASLSPAVTLEFYSHSSPDSIFHPPPVSLRI